MVTFLEEEKERDKSVLAIKASTQRHTHLHFFGQCKCKSSGYTQV